MNVVIDDHLWLVRVGERAPAWAWHEEGQRCDIESAARRRADRGAALQSLAFGTLSQHRVQRERKHERYRERGRPCRSGRPHRHPAARWERASPRPR